MHLGWILACTAPITAFIVFHLCIATMRQYKQEEAVETSGVFILFSFLYIIGAVALLFHGNT